MSNGRLSWKALALLATGAAGVRLVYLLALARAYTPRRDANHYQAIAKAFAQGDGIAGIFPFTFQHLTALRPPLYPALLGAVLGHRCPRRRRPARERRAWCGGRRPRCLLGAHIAVRRHRGRHRRGRLPAPARERRRPSASRSPAPLLTMILLLVRDRPAWAGAVRTARAHPTERAAPRSWSRHGWSGAGWRSAARFGADHRRRRAMGRAQLGLVGTLTVVTLNGFNLVSTYSSEAQASWVWVDGSVRRPIHSYQPRQPERSRSRGRLP